MIKLWQGLLLAGTVSVLSVQAARAEEVGSEEVGESELPIHSSTHPLSSTLRSFLAEQLPDYMLPSFFMQLDDLPRLPNGKLNSQALPIPTDRKSVV